MCFINLNKKFIMDKWLSTAVAGLVGLIVVAYSLYEGRDNAPYVSDIDLTNAGSESDLETIAETNTGKILN